MRTPERQAPTTEQPRPKNDPRAALETPQRPRYGVEIITVAALIVLIGTGAAVASTSATSNRVGATTTQTSSSSVVWPVAGSSVLRGSETP